MQCSLPTAHKHLIEYGKLTVPQNYKIQRSKETGTLSESGGRYMVTTSHRGE